MSEGVNLGARVLARVLAAVVDHGEEEVGRTLEEALSTQKLDLLAPAPTVRAVSPRRNPVPEGLAGYVVENPDAALYDALLKEVEL